jgi:hypothetical protein
MDVSFVGDQSQTVAPLSNRSTFMVNIGTHKLPESLRDYAVLQESLVDTIKRILAVPDISEKILHYVEKNSRGKLNKFPAIGVEFVETPKARFTVERGTVTGRIDAHILMDYVHRTKIMFNTHAFQEILDQELEVENMRFIHNRVRDENGKTMKWAKPRCYVSVRLIGRILAVDAEKYIAKNYGNPSVYSTEMEAERKLRPLIRSDLVGGTPVNRGSLSFILNDS